MSHRYEGSHPLAGCQLKLDRANEQIEALDRSIKGFLNRYTHVPVTKVNLEAAECFTYMKVREAPPLRWGIIVGEIVHNLRSVLDYLVFQLAYAHTGKIPKGTAYPAFTDDPFSPETDKGTRRRWKTQTGGLHPDDHATIERAQPYNRKNSMDRHHILMLTRLSNRDKHQTLHLAASVVNNSDFGFKAVKDCELGTAEFGHIGPFEHGTIVATCPILRIVSPQAQVHVKGQLAFGVAFADGSPPGIAGREVINVLGNIAGSVHDIVLELGMSPRFDQDDS